VLIVVIMIVPLVLAIVDLAVLLVLAALGIVGRLLFRRPWTIEAVGSDDTRLTWHAVGWRASAARRDEIATALAAGVVPPPDPEPVG
jgi:hypothetical protein